MVDPNSERLGKIQRKHIRIEVELKVRFRIVGDPQEAIYSALTKDISLGGMCLKIAEHGREVVEKLGGRLPNLQVSLLLTDDDRPVSAVMSTAWISGKVGWMLRPSDGAAPIFLGMAFIDMSVKDKSKIDSFIADVIMNRRETVEEQEKRILSKVIGPDSSGTSR